MKSKRKRLVAELDKVFSLYIRYRDKKCVLCGKTDSLQCGHIFSRINYSTRWDKMNCWCQCSGCNLKHEYEAYTFYNWFIEKFGKKEFDNLHFQAHQIRKFKDYELEEMIKEYKEKIDKLLYTKKLPF
jgi:hypothetical protein